MIQPHPGFYFQLHQPHCYPQISNLFPVWSHGASSGSGHSLFPPVSIICSSRPPLQFSDLHPWFSLYVPAGIFPRTFWTCGPASRFVGHFYPLRHSLMWFLLFIACPFSRFFARLPFVVLLFWSESLMVGYTSQIVATHVTRQVAQW